MLADGPKRSKLYGPNPSNALRMPVIKSGGSEVNEGMESSKAQAVVTQATPQKHVSTPKEPEKDFKSAAAGDDGDERERPEDFGEEAIK
jgi:hypothetical protein